jgi:hypothetical protein
VNGNDSSARSPAAPLNRDTRHLAVTRSWIGWHATLPFFCSTTSAPPQYRRCRIRLIRAMRRTIEHFADRNRRDPAVVTAAAKRRVKEQVPGFSKPASATRSGQS